MRRDTKYADLTTGKGDDEWERT